MNVKLIPRLLMLSHLHSQRKAQFHIAFPPHCPASAFLSLISFIRHAATPLGLLIGVE
jgi:hypothetical protein